MGSHSHFISSSCAQLSEECSNAFTEVMNEIDKDRPSCWQKPWFSANRCECESSTKIIGELRRKLSTNPICDADALECVVARWEDDLIGSCMTETGSVCKAFVERANLPLEEQNVACRSRAGDNWTKQERCNCDTISKQVTVLQTLLQIPDATQCTHEDVGEPSNFLKGSWKSVCALGGWVEEISWRQCWVDVWTAAPHEEWSSCIEGLEWQRCDCQLIPKLIAASEEILARPDPIQCHGSTASQSDLEELERSVDVLRTALAKCG